MNIGDMERACEYCIGDMQRACEYRGYAEGL